VTGAAVIRRQDYGAFGEDLAITEVQPLPASAKQPQFAGRSGIPRPTSTTSGRYYGNT
jgi:hypothetical protein